MKTVLIAAALAMLASVSTAQAALKGTNRAAFTQAFIAKCAVYDSRYSAQAVLNYCNCGAQRVASFTTDEQIMSGAARAVFHARRESLVAFCKAKYLR
jgi:hypothetical protein